MNLELMGALNELEKERGIAKEILLEAIEAAIMSAYKRNYGTAQNVRVDMKEKNGEIHVYARKLVVEDVEDEASQISLEEAQKLNPNYELDDVIEVEITPSDFGRIAAQTAKQVVMQRIREAERALIYEEFSNREGDIITGIVQRREHRNVMIDLGKTEAILGPGDQMSTDNYSQGTRLKVYISEVKQTSKGPQIYVSRTHPGLVIRLFELEVPEVQDGTVEIRAVAREAGARSKLAVSSRNADVDPVGACVGPRGMRVQSVVSELRGEKIDIVAWATRAEDFVANALSPAQVVKVYLDEEAKTARAVVPDNQLSLAIGKEGQNARLAARLTGWKIDIKSQQQMAELLAREAFERVTPQKEPEEPEEAELEVTQSEPGVESAEREERETVAVAPAETVTEEEAPQPDGDLVCDEEKEELAPEEKEQEIEEEEEKEKPAAQVPAEELPEVSPEEEEEEKEESGDKEPLLPGDYDELEEIEEDRRRRRGGKRAPAALTKAKSRKSEKQRVESFIEEELIDEEPLPSLFSPEGEEPSEDELERYLSDQKEAETGFSLAGRVKLNQSNVMQTNAENESKKSSKSEKKKKKKILKDFSELSLDDLGLSDED